jgi:hypothetical protein
MTAAAEKQTRVFDESFGLRHRPRAKEDGIDDADQCGVPADAQRQDDDRNQRKAGFLEKRPYCVSQVLQQGKHASPVFDILTDNCR